jgi:hypothetical protein
MELETVRHGGDLLRQCPQLLQRHGSHRGIRPVPLHVRLPVDRERRLVVRDDGLVGVLAAVHRGAIGRDHRVRFVRANEPFGDQLVRVQLARAFVQRDFLVHQGLRHHRLVGLVVP